MKFEIWNEECEISKQDGEKIKAQVIFMKVGSEIKNFSVPAIKYVNDIKDYVNILITEFLKIH